MKKKSASKPMFQLRRMIDRAGRWTYAVVCTAAGILLLVNPVLAANVILWLSAVLAAAAGVFSVVTYFRKKPAPGSHDYSFAAGVTLITASAAVVIWPGAVSELVLKLIGVMLMLGGFVDLQKALDGLRLGAKLWWVYLIAAVLSVTFGMFFFALPTVIVLLGIGLVLCGIMTLALHLLHGMLESPDGKLPLYTRTRKPERKPVPQEEPEEPEADEIPETQPETPVQPEPLMPVQPMPEPAAEEVHAAPQLDFKELK